MVESMETEMQQWRRENEDLRMALEAAKAQHQLKLDEMEILQKKKLAGLISLLIFFSLPSSSPIFSFLGVGEEMKSIKEQSGDFPAEKKKLTGSSPFLLLFL